MLSRTAYKGVRIDWGLDQCAAALPQPATRSRPPVMAVPSIQSSMTNTYALLDTGSEIDSDAPNESFMMNIIPPNRNKWANAAVA